MKKLIVFEGVDGTGKTTAAKSLGSEPNFKYLKNPNGALSEGRKYVDAQNSYMARFFYYMACNLDISSQVENMLKEDSIALDRYYHSTWAYHNIMLNKDMSRYIEDAGLMQPYKLFLFVADYDIIRKRILERNGQTTDSAIEKNIELIMRVQDEYLRICPWADIVDTSKLNKEQTIKYIKSALGIDRDIAHSEQSKKRLVKVQNEI